MEALWDIFSTEGRATRASYFWHIVLDDVLIVTMIVFLMVLSLSAGMLVVLPAMGVVAGGLWAALCITVKRLHDLDRPGWHFWLFLVPFYNFYLSLVLLFAKGTDGPNQYGRDPLQAATIPTSHHLDR